VRTADELKTIVDNVEEKLSRSIMSCGLRRRSGAVLERIPDHTVIVPCNAESELRIARLLARELPRAPFAHRMFDAAICATQVHLDVLDDGLYSLLPGLYAIEYLVPLLFANGSTFAGQHAHCVRPLIWRDCFSQSYLAHGFPDPVPASAAEHGRLLDATPGFIRDYTLIAPRPMLGSVEFRSACAQDTLARIIELIALRLASYAAARAHQIAPRSGMREHFHDVCDTGRFRREWAIADHAALLRQDTVLPSDLVPALHAVCDRLQHLLVEGADA
jgi:hypothetical protein